MKTCPRCHVDLEPTDPVVGEVWLYVATGVLYRVTEPYGHTHESFTGQAKVPWAGAERLHPPRGHEPATEHSLAMWPDKIRAGEWVRVTTPVEHMRSEPR